ncbi:probable E3 ubiquitin-protein ligase MID2 [Mytilus edulis]|uniref:probable E3 ubiquitin-protein ligase MID2 n=1 Tax=Mytilus edulis TaxID=6550 RepID=UPI0039F0702C
MATRSLNVIEEEDNLLTCSICLETYKTPKYLTCLHTFCKVCIQTYIQSSVDKENIISFKRPVCRTLVSVGERSNLEYWANELPTNHLISSMIDQQAIQKQEQVCNACELSNVKQMAVSWCTVCQEALCSVCERKFKVSANHKIVTVQEVQRGITTSFSGLITCDVHSNKFVEIFCLDHSRHCCTLCASVKHSKCENVVELGEAAAGIKEAKQTNEYLELIMQWIKLLNKSIQDTHKNMCTVENMGKNIVSEIENLKRDIIKHFDKVEQTTKEELVSKKKEIEKLKSDLIDHINKLEKSAKEELVVKKKDIITEVTDRMTEMSRLKSTMDIWHNILSTCINDGSEI